MNCRGNCDQGRRCTCAPRQARPWWIALPGLVVLLSLVAAATYVIAHTGR